MSDAAKRKFFHQHGFANDEAAARALGISMVELMQAFKWAEAIRLPPDEVIAAYKWAKAGEVERRQMAAKAEAAEPENRPGRYICAMCTAHFLLGIPL